MKICFLMMATVIIHAGDMRLRLIGEQTFPNQSLRFQDTVPGGLSGIDYDAQTGLFWVISDDPTAADRGAPRFYSVRLDYDQHAFHGYEFQSVTTMKNAEGATFADSTVDPEALRRSSAGTFFWTSEGYENSDPQIDPFLWEMNAEGQFVRAFEIPERYFPTFG